MKRSMHHQPSSKMELAIHIQQQLAQSAGDLLRERYDLGPGATAYTIGPQGAEAIVVICTDPKMVPLLQLVVAENITSL